MPTSYRSRRRSSRRRTATTLVVSVLAVAAIAGGAFAALNGLFAGGQPPPISITPRCFASTDAGKAALDPEQSANAALIAAVGQSRGMSPRAVTIALATAMQESKLRNLDYGDRDSLGLFQQRPSQAWGTPEQIMDPVYSAGEFYKELAKVPDYETAPITEAAQAVQRSAYPEAYAQHENAARSFASALTGHSPGGLTCTLGPAAEASDPALFIATFQAEWGDSAGGGITTTADAARPGGDGTASGPAVTLRAGSSTEGWAYAQWAVAKARQLGVAAVEADGQVWDRADTSWQPTSSPAAGDPGTGQLVTVHLVSLPTDPP